GIEIQAAAIAGFKELADRRAAKLVAKLQVVPRALPGKVVDQLIVNVRAGSWHGEGGADVCDTEVVMDTNQRQSEILGIGDPGVQANRVRIEVAIFGKETFLEAVVTKA